MSGEKSLEEQLAIFERVYKEYKQGLQLNHIEKFDYDVNFWMKADGDAISILSAAQCGEIAQLFLRYRTFISGHLSNEKSRLKIVKSIINQWAAPYWYKYRNEYMSADMKLEKLAQKDNMALQKPLKLKKWIECRVETLEESVGLAKDYYHFYMGYAKLK